MEGAVQQYIGRKTQAGWVVSFGHVDPKDGRFLVTHEAVQKAGKPEDFDVRELNPPKGDDTYLQAASKAIDLALKDFVKNFKGEPRPYNVAILPAEKGQFWVYLLPAQTKVGVWPLGGDFRYLLSADGAKIVAKRQLHKEIIENDPPQETKDKTQVAGMHTHVLDDIPEDTDVFHVLVRKPSVPELIVTKRFRYNVDPNGVVTFVGKSEDATKR